MIRAVAARSKTQFVRRISSGQPDSTNIAFPLTPSHASTMEGHVVHNLERPWCHK